MSRCGRWSPNFPDWSRMLGVGLCKGVSTSRNRNYLELLHCSDTRRSLEICRNLQWKWDKGCCKCKVDFKTCLQVCRSDLPIPDIIVRNTVHLARKDIQTYSSSHFPFWMFYCVLKTVKDSSSRSRSYEVIFWFWFAVSSPLLSLILSFLMLCIRYRIPHQSF